MSLRRGSDQLASLGFHDVRVITVDVDESSAGPEAAAREARYAALDAGPRARAPTVLLGHTLDDQAETVLLGLARGSGTRSLAGMGLPSGHSCARSCDLPSTTTEEVCAERAWSPGTIRTTPTRVHPGPGAARRPATAGGPSSVRASRKPWPARRSCAAMTTTTLDQLAARRPARRRAGRADARLRRAWTSRLRRCAAGSSCVALARGAGASRPAAPLAAVEALVVDWHGRAGRLPGRRRSARHRDGCEPACEPRTPGVPASRRGGDAWIPAEAARLPVRRRSQVDSADVAVDLKHVLVTKDQIQHRMHELAAEIDRTTRAATCCSSASSTARSW